MTQELTYTEQAYIKLEHLCITRIYDRYDDDDLSEAYRRMEKELVAIKKKGTAPLFIVVYEALCGVGAKHAKFSLRGDTGSSVVAYLLDISAIDPVRIRPRLYSEFCFGLNGEENLSIEINVTRKLYRKLVNYFEHYNGDARIRYKHCTSGIVRGVGISDPQVLLCDYYDDNELLFGFLEISGQKRIGRKVLSGPAFELFKPLTFEDQVKCRGLSVEGNGVWEENAEELAKSGEIALGDLIAHREDVFEFMHDHGIEREKAYQISEDIRWGRIKRNGWDAETIALLYNAGIPEWYLKSCEKISHVFPRAHSMIEIQHYGGLVAENSSDRIAIS